ncbi:MAG: hypothetical protein ACJ71U_21125 [Terriglobales bacterium]
MKRFITILLLTSLASSAPSQTAKQKEKLANTNREIQAEREKALVETKYQGMLEAQVAEQRLQIKLNPETYTVRRIDETSFAITCMNGDPTVTNAGKQSLLISCGK